MSDSFDPYHKWLGIPPKDQPPDHYRLLGIERFETDADVIGFAADARMAHVRSLAVGPHGPLSQELLNAIASARVCLLNSQTKTEYDQSLRQQIEPPATVLEEQPAPPPAEYQVEPPPICRQQVASPPAWEVVPEQNLLPKWALALAGATAGVLLLAMVAWLASSSRRPVAQLELPPAPEDVEAAAAAASAEPGPPDVTPSAPDSTSSDQNGTDPEPTADSVRDQQPSEQPSDEGEPPAADAQTDPEKHPAVEQAPDVRTPQAEPGNVPEQPSPTEETPADEKPPGDVQPPAGERPPAAEETPADEKLPADDAMPTDNALPEEPLAAQGKRPVPSAEELAELQKQLDDFYGPQQADSPRKRRELAERLLVAASDPLKRPSAQYVLMRNAWELSAKAGDVDRAMTMIDQAAELYAMNPLDAKVDVVKTAERSARAGSDAEAALPQLLERTESLIGLLLDEDHYAAAVELVEQVGIPVAGRIDDGRQVAEWIERRTEFRNLQEEYAPVARARESLQADPSDAAANLTVGRWLCLVKGHWPEGLQYLALGGNEPLARLAARDLEGPSGAEQQIELADGWWNLSQHAEFRQKPPVAASLQARATLWYHEALPSVSGPLRERAEKRLGISGTAEPEGGKQALAFDGRHSHAVVNFGYAGTCAITLEVIARPERMEGAGSAISNYDPDRRSGLTLGTMGGVSWFFSFLEASPHPRQPALTIGTPIRAVARPTPGGTGWCHVAAVFDGKEIRLYVDGQLRDSKAIGGPHRPTTKLPLIIGASPARVAASGLVVDSHYKGLLKAVRISDIARYTQDFSPPAQLAREDNHTQLLLLFDKETGETVPDSATGKTSAPGSKRAPASFARLFGTQWVDAQGDNASSQQPPNNGGR